LLLLALSVIRSGNAANAAGESNRTPPDVLFIMLDDSGYTDFGCYGSQIQTPSIDRLASEGVRFTDCHAAAPNCSPSRAGMLTGRIPSRIGIYSYIPPRHPMHLRGSEITVAELLKEAGYTTGHFGKWHLSQLEWSSEQQPQPNDQGFDVSFGTTNNASPSHLNPTNFVRNKVPVGTIDGYSCQIVVDETCDWLDSLAPADRFFGCVWFHEPHSKIASPPELVAKYEKLYPKLSKKQATYYANIENVDIAVGRLLEKLDSLSRSENTFVFLTSDNGGVNDWSNQGLRGKKSFVYEGGQREPGILRWPGYAKAGSIDDTPISHLDLFPTVCEIAGIDPPADRKLDGTSLVPLLRDQSFERETPLFWYFYRVKPAAAMRDGDWVILGYLDDPIAKHTHPLTAPDMPMIKSAQLNQFELYNLADDLGQQNDLAATHLERLDRMRRRMVELHREVVADGPVWDLGP
jgi:arylsulfatase A